MSSIEWRCQSFETLSTKALFDIFSLRQAVFVVEQHCAYADIDATDLFAWHLSGWRQESLVAYARLIPAGVRYEEMSIGRVAVCQHARGQGLGERLMRKAIDELYVRYPNQAIKLGAQQHLSQFYQSLGFRPVSEVYLEDGIAHIDMRKPAKESD